MTKKYIIGNTYYFNIPGVGVTEGELISTSAKFCTFNVRGHGKPRRKSKQNVFEKKSQVELDLIMNIDIGLKEMYGMNVMEIATLFNKLVEEYPEKFV